MSKHCKLGSFEVRRYWPPAGYLKIPKIVLQIHANYKLLVDNDFEVLGQNG